MSQEVYANPNALVSADWLAAHFDDPGVRVVEVDVSPKSYNEGHIPGAVFWDIYKTLKDPNYQLIDAIAFENILSTSGISPSTKVVFYGYGPALGYWLMKLYGHADASVLNLSKSRWQADGWPSVMTEPQPQATHYRLLQPNSEIRALQPMVAASIGVKDCAILDVRTGAEFRGERFWPSGAAEATGRAGHIPGALNVPLDTILNDDGTFAPIDVLRRTFPAQIDDVRDLITYCTIGNRASVAWFVLSELLGRRDVRVYDGSWAEWGHMTATPIEMGAARPAAS